MMVKPPPAVDPIGPFPPRLVYASILLLDVIGVVAVLVLLLAGIDWTEDLLMPGGVEWLPF